MGRGGFQESEPRQAENCQLTSTPAQEKNGNRRVVERQTGGGKKWEQTGETVCRARSLRGVAELVQMFRVLGFPGLTGFQASPVKSRENPGERVDWPATARTHHNYLRQRRHLQATRLA